jgi:hypothetical protein
MGYGKGSYVVRMERFLRQLDRPGKVDTDLGLATHHQRGSAGVAQNAKLGSLGMHRLNLQEGRPVVGQLAESLEGWWEDELNKVPALQRPERLPS